MTVVYVHAFQEEAGQWAAVQIGAHRPGCRAKHSRGSGWAWTHPIVEVTGDRLARRGNGGIRWVELSCYDWECPARARVRLGAISNLAAITIRARGAASREDTQA